MIRIVFVAAALAAVSMAVGMSTVPASAWVQCYHGCCHHSENGRDWYEGDCGGQNYGTCGTGNNDPCTVR